MRHHSTAVAAIGCPNLDRAAFGHMRVTKIFFLRRCNMTHLSSPQRVAAMVFYSLLTFFLGPLLTRPLLRKHPDQCVAGFTVGFAISVVLWTRFGYFLP